MKVMGPSDSVWLLLESQDTPMHFGTLMTFSPPARSPADYVERLVAQARQSRAVQPPWNFKLVQGLFGRTLPVLREDDRVDLDHHVRYHSVPNPGARGALIDFVCQLHAPPLDLTKPLWETHLIDGLGGKRFAMYTKIHHSLLDGGSALRLLIGMLSATAKERDMAPMWSKALPTSDGSAPGAPPPRARGGRLRAPAKVLSHLLDGSLAVPYTEPHSILRQTVTAPRGIALQEFDLAQVKTVAKAAGCTVNDLVLYLCGSALRRFLDEGNCLPDRPLTAAVPVSVRSADDQNGVGNATTQLYVNLATHVPDPRDRLEAIKKSVAAGKAGVETVPGDLRSLSMLSITAPYVLGMAAGLRGRAPVPYSLNISNVPGPPNTLYFNGAKLEGIYPVSFLMHGGALIVLCTSYAGKLVLTVTGASEQLPNFARIADDLQDAFDEIAALLTSARSKRPAGRTPNGRR